MVLYSKTLVATVLKTAIEHRYVTVDPLGRPKLTFRQSGKRIELVLSVRQADTLLGELYDVLSSLQRDRRRVIETDDVLRHLKELS